MEIKDKEKQAIQRLFSNFEQFRSKQAFELMNLDDLMIDTDTSDLMMIAVDFMNNAKNDKQLKTATKVFNFSKRLFAFNEIYKERLKVVMFKIEVLELENQKCKQLNEYYKRKYEEFKEKYENLLNDAV